MERLWWKNAVVYEIYCKSFCDSNGDGIGDLRGVLSKLPVLKELGVNCIWFAPIYPSPQVDNGYDVADYQDIEPAYGTLEDFKDILAAAHGLGIRVILDMVLNHSSDEHPWFRESRSSKDNHYRNYYIWQPPKADGSAPNNWGNYFREADGSAWTLDEQTGEYYLHQYSVKMPDLNWEYEPLRQEIYRMLNWWLDLGVDGFRLDVFTRLKKPAGFPDSPCPPDPRLDRNGFVVDRSMCTNVEGIHEILHGLYTNVFCREGCATVGEGAGVTPENALDYVAAARQEVNMVYHFDLAERGRYAITPGHFRTVQTRWADVIRRGGWAVQYLSNHDSARQVSCYGSDGAYRVPSAKLLATLLHTTPGTPFIYQGEEIGMTSVRFDDIRDYNCRYTVGDYASLVANGAAPQEALDIVAPRSRDNARTPYQWDDSANAGFTTGTPWMKLNPRWPEINLEADRRAPDSIFAYYQKLTRLRAAHPAIVDGDLRFLLDDHPQILAYTRTCADGTLLVVANKSDRPAALHLPEPIRSARWRRILTNLETPRPALERTSLEPWEAEVYQKISEA